MVIATSIFTPGILAPWLAAPLGLLAVAAFLLGMSLWRLLFDGLGRLVARQSPSEWHRTRLNHFWLLNAATAPFMALFWFGSAYLLDLSGDQMGLNLRNPVLGLSVGIGVALLMGIPSAIQAPYLVRRGMLPLQVDFGRSRLDMIGVILYGALLVGPLEEIPFRGIVQAVLMRAFPWWLHAGPFAATIGTFLAAVVFVAYHYRNVQVGGETRQQFMRLIPGRLIASLTLSLLFQGTGSLLGPIIFHNLLDTCTFVALATTQYQMRFGRPAPAALTPEQVS